MKIYHSIEDLKRDLNINRPSIHPEYHILKHSELSEINFDALQLYKKKFFSIDLVLDQAWSLQIGHTSIDDLRNSAVFISPYQLQSLNKYHPNLLKNGFTLFFSERFFIPNKYRCQIQKEFPFFKLNTSPNYLLDTTQKKQIFEMMELMFNEVAQPDDRSIEISRGYLTVLLNTLKRILKTYPVVDRMSRHDEITCKFEELLLSELAKYKTIAAFAEKLNITPAYLSECTKKSTGLPAKRILANHILLHSKSLIMQTDKSIAEIAAEVGFSEPTNFIKFFKNIENVTPNFYRKHP